MPKVRDAFALMDKDGSNSLSKEEFDCCSEDVRRLIEKTVGKGDVEDLFEFLDQDGTGEVDIDEFCEGIMRLAVAETSIEIIQIRSAINHLKAQSHTRHSELKGMMSKQQEALRSTKKLVKQEKHERKHRLSIVTDLDKMTGT